MRPKLSGPAVIVDPYSSGAQFAPAFREQGVPCIAVVTGPEPPPAYASSYRPADFGEILTFDGDLEGLASTLRARSPRCLIAGCESGVELAERLAPLVTPALANVAGLAPARRDKAEMAHAVAAAGLAVIEQICTATPDEVASWLDRADLAGADLVIKPPTSASTDGVIKVPGGRDWREVFARQIGRANMFGGRDDKLIVQQYVTGTEYVVDTFSHDGEHTVTDVCRYHKLDNGPYMAVYDSMRWMPLDDPDVPPVVEYARAVLDAVGMRFGAAHVEIMDTAAGPVLIELGARPHGGGHPQFNRAATGDSQVDRTVRYLTGGQIPRGYDLRRHQLVVFHIARETGIVRNAALLAEIRHLSSHHFSVCNVADGDRVKMTRDLIGSLNLGFAVLSHPDADQVERDYQTIRDLEAKLVID